MRIAIVNWSKRRVGGVETYLNTVIPELARAGHELAFWHEVDEPVGRAQIEMMDEMPTWCVAEMGQKQALRELLDWQPEVIYAHKLSDPGLERKVLSLAPSVFFAHDYNGTCISGTKTFKSPVVRPCNRRFGWQCLMHYFPHRCGGLSPITMFKLYGLQSRRLKNLRRYDAIVTHSDHMLSELIRHGLSPKSAYNFPYYVPAAQVTGKSHQQRSLPEPLASLTAQTTREHGRPSETRAATELNLLFSGRMEYLKGGHVLLEALPLVAAAFDKTLRVTFAGDGRERRDLERRAQRIRSPQIKIEFVGWVERRRIETLLENCDLLVVPSLWPEPFGLVGPEAGHFGVPVAAFDVGGIHDWLLDGVNGYLASGNPPTSRGLAEAIIKSLSDPAVHARLRTGAVEVAQQFNIRNHLTALLEVFHSVASNNTRPPFKDSDKTTIRSASSSELQR